MKVFLICWVFVLYAYSFDEVEGSIFSYTSYGSAFSRLCPSGESLVRIRSIHSDQREDRAWSFKCLANRRMTTSCKWSLPDGQYLNEYDKDVLFTCPNSGYIVGMHAGSHHGYYNDRRFDFRCCNANKGGHSNCYWTSHVNDWDKRMDYSAPSGYHIAGVFSRHNDYYEDRRWKFYICQ